MNATENDVVIAPTVFVRAHAGAGSLHVEAGVVEHERERALLVFRSKDEANRYRSEDEASRYPAREGWGALTLELEDLRNLLDTHECPRVASPTRG